MAGDHKGVMAHNSFGGANFGFRLWNRAIRDCAISYRLVTLSPSTTTTPLFFFLSPCAPPGVSGHANSHYRRFIGNLIWLTRANRQSALSRNCHGFELKSAKSNWQSPHFAS